MADIFETSSINQMILRNRLVRSATCEWMATPDGLTTKGLNDRMAALAAGGVGLIITGHAYVEPRGKASPWQLGIDADQCITGLQQMCDGVHARGGKIAVQLAHAGLFAHPGLSGHPPLAPSAIRDFNVTVSKQMHHKEIEEVVAAFQKAAWRALRAGFDGIQIHAAHGYLLSQFLSPAFNRRTDEYGGNVDSRARLLLEVLSAVRSEVGNSYPILVKINCADFLEGGIDIEESIQAGKLLASHGIDAIELSGGTIVSGVMNHARDNILSPEDEAYFKSRALHFKNEVDVPLILVGGIRSLAVARNLVAERDADFISMSRPFIREPDLATRWQKGTSDRASCISCSKCRVPARHGKGLFCVKDGTFSDQQRSLALS